MIKAISVEAFQDFSIAVELEDGKRLKVDMSYIKEENGPVVDPLKDFSSFKNVFIRNGIVTWSTGYDIDPYHLIEVGIEIKTEATGS